MSRCADAGCDKHRCSIDAVQPMREPCLRDALAGETCDERQTHLRSVRVAAQDNCPAPGSQPPGRIRVVRDDDRPGVDWHADERLREIIVPRIAVVDTDDPEVGRITLYAHRFVAQHAYTQSSEHLEQDLNANGMIGVIMIPEHGYYAVRRLQGTEQIWQAAIPGVDSTKSPESTMRSPCFAMAREIARAIVSAAQPFPPI